MSRTRDISKVLSSNTDLVTTAELNSALAEIDLSEYLTISSASTTYATQASLSTIDADNNPDILMNMGG
jgi:CO dehydrogenase/acetyl-CoA synthase epsilon subunit